MNARRFDTVLVFGRNRAGGNPATVVRCFDDAPSDAEMQRIAAERNTQACAFVLGSQELPSVRFFTPSAELSFCGHGSLAAGSVLASARSMRAVDFLVGSRRVTVRSDQPGIATLIMNGEPSGRSDFDRGAILSALGIGEAVVDRDAPFMIGSAGSPKWLVPLASIDALRGVQPDLDRLTDLSRAESVNGAYVYTLHTKRDEVHALARGFNPKAGVAEDAATGVAAAALAWALRDLHSRRPWFVVEQGIRLEELSRILVRVEPERISVGGEVRLAE